MSVSHFFEHDLFNAASVSLLTSTESAVIDLSGVFGTRIESIAFTASSVAGTADIKLEWVGSRDGTNFQDYSENADLTASTLIDFPTAPEGFHVIAFPGHLVPFLKVKATGITANPADTLLTVKLIIREELGGQAAVR